MEETSEIETPKTELCEMLLPEEWSVKNKGMWLKRRTERPAYQKGGLGEDELAETGL